MKATIRTALALSLAACASAASGAPKTVGWNYTVSIAPGGSHVLGNPDAKVRVVQYSSYTCSRCAAFAVQSEAQMQIGYISSGRVSFELRHYLRNAVDMTVAMLVECGPPERFFLNHTAFLHRQDSWIGPLSTASDGQKRRWHYGTLLQRNRAIASDFGLFRIMEARGVSRTETERCLADQSVANRIAAQSQAAVDQGIIDAPRFFINGAPVAGVDNWAALRPQIDKAL